MKHPTPKNQYCERDLEELGSHYIRHVSSMTKENLNSKAEIAAELAYRDFVIESLNKKISLMRD
jgi:hypothetical protein